MEKDRYERALHEIGRIASDAVSDRRSGEDGQPAQVSDAAKGCRIMTLPPRLQQKAAHVAVRLNPANAPLHEFAVLADGGPLRPEFATVTTNKYWGPKPKTFTVSFIETTAASLRARIVSHLNAWSPSCGISFTQTGGTGDVRITREEEGYWSYLGTDIRLIPLDRPTMSLQGFTMSYPEREYRRVLRHEAGHTLGFPHEHMRQALIDRIDPQKAYEYFLETQGWPPEVVDEQVLTPLGPNSIIGTEPDEDSIMCYQLPGEITRDGQPIAGGTDINQTDAAFAGTVYPKILRVAEAEPVGAAVVPAPRRPTVPDWEPQEDVSVAL